MVIIIMRMGEGKLAMKYLYNGYRKEKYLLGGLEKDGSMASKNCSKKAGGNWLRLKRKNILRQGELKTAEVFAKLTDDYI